MQKLNEDLLAAWLGLSASVRNDRVVDAMSYNETHICNLLYRAMLNGAEPLTATVLCKKTGLLVTVQRRTLHLLQSP